MSIPLPDQPSWGRSQFPPIGDYGFLSDCETTALVAPNGGIEWLCLPRMDSPSVFGAILDRDAGSFRINPAGVEVPAARRYIPGTMVLETSWWTPGGWLVVTDALLIGPWHHHHERSITNRRAPTDYDADHVLLRLIRCVNGQVQVRMYCNPVFDYGRHPAQWEYVGEGYREALASAEGAERSLRLTTDLNVGFEGPLATARTLLKEGQTRFVALSWSEHAPPRIFEEADARLTWTAHHWQHWLDRGRFPDHPWRSFLQRSALTLKGLTFAPTGGVVASATTSLPETPGGVRNWDYRYTWIRDTAATLWALYALGFDWEANDFFHFVADVAVAATCRSCTACTASGRCRSRRWITCPGTTTRGRSASATPRTPSASTTCGAPWSAPSTCIPAHTNGSTTGSGPSSRPRCSGPSNTGGARSRHLGGPLGTSALHLCQGGLLGGCRRRGAARRGPGREEAGRAMAYRGRGDPSRRARPRRRRARRLHPALRRQGARRVGAADPSSPLPPPDDQRVRNTVLAIADQLTEDEMVLRYRVDETEDGLTGEEGTFTICSFWLVSALLQIGEPARARALCEKLLSYASPLQLYAEEIDSRTGRQLGNFPQAFTHLALITAVTAVIRAERAQPR